MRAVAAVPGQPGLISTFFDLGEHGYVAEEFFCSGTATAYEHAAPPGPDGHWAARPAGSAPFTTRVVVYRPADPAAFDGTVVVEWLNVSSGADAPAVWLLAHRHLLRAGHAWVGVTAQRDGVDGGSLFAELDAADPGWATIILPPLKRSDPERYARLDHPGNAYAYDIFAQVGAALRAPDASGLLGPLRPERLLAAGESQSAAALVTHLNAVEPLASGYDGYLLIGRPGRPLGLASGSLAAAEPVAARIRTDLDVPVLVLQSETDVAGMLDSAPSRQPDGPLLRLWELAGAAHADTYTLGAAFLDSGSLAAPELAALLAAKDDPLGVKYAAPINSGPQQHYLAQTAVAALLAWAAQGVGPPVADRLELDSGGLRTDRHGIARGGVRTPWVDVPAAVLSGLGQEASPGPALLFGSTLPLAGLAELYPDGAAGYVPAFLASAEKAVAAGFLLAADLEEAVAVAATAFPG